MGCRFSRGMAAALAVLALGAGPGVAQTGAVLGPKDGAGLAPTDTTRVAVGTPAPDFTLESRRGARVTLSDYRGRKDVILVFYRGHW